MFVDCVRGKRSFTESGVLPKVALMKHGVLLKVALITVLHNNMRNVVYFWP